MARFSKSEREDAITRLRALLTPGTTVYTVLRSVSRSGMTRGIDCYLLTEDGPQWLSYLVAKATDTRFNDKRDCLTVEGCGMDMGWHLVHCLSYALYPDSFECIGTDCPSNDHFNGDRDYSPHTHTSGGYALKHRWL